MVKKKQNSLCICSLLSWFTWPAMHLAPTHMHTHTPSRVQPELLQQKGGGLAPGALVLMSVGESWPGQSRAM